MKVYSFIPNNNFPIPDILNGKTIAQYLEQNFKNPTFNHDLSTKGSEKRSGYVFDFTEDLRCFWIKTEHYGIVQIFAPNATYARKAVRGHGKIYKIIEVK